MHSFKATSHLALTANLPCPHREIEALDRELPEVATRKNLSDLSTGLLRNDQCSRFGQSLKTGREVGGVANYLMLRADSMEWKFPSHDQARGDTDPHLE